MAKLTDVKKILNGLIADLQSQKELNKLGLAGIRKIKDRTRKGIDVDGSAFQPYSTNYAEKRASFGLPTSIVNLEFNDIDGMLSKVDHVVANDFKSVAIDILDPRKKRLASYHDELGVGKAGQNIRHFWGLSSEDEKDIAEIVAADMTRLLNALTDKFSSPGV